MVTIYYQKCYPGTGISNFVFYLPRKGELARAAAALTGLETKL
jgi:hypothetical protein